MTSKNVKQQNLDHTLFSWSAQGNLNPIDAVSAKGVYIYDRDDKKYIDFSSQLMNTNIGHCDPRVAKTVAEQMQKLCFVAPSMATEPRGKLGAKLAEISPEGLNKTFFTLGGAEAIENSIKLARLYTGRHKILTHYRAYHGATYGAASAGGDPRRHKIDAQQMPNVVHFENPYFYRCPWYSSSWDECRDRALANLEMIIRYEDPNNCAAILVEGESGTSGCIKYPEGYLQGIRALCDKYGIVMIADEVMSGFGRTGEWFGVQRHNVNPDIIAMAKGLTSGYLPLGGVLVHDKISSMFDEQAMPLGLTYSAHAVSCAAANAVIDIYEKDNLIPRTRELEKYMNRRMAEIQEKHPSFGDFRNTGLLGVIELVKDKKTKEPMAPWNAKPSEMAVMKQVGAKIRELGMFTFVKWNFIFVAPPLTSTEDEIEEGLAIIEAAIDVADAAC